MELNISSTDKIIISLEMPQVNYDKQQNKALQLQFANKLGVPVNRVQIETKPITIDANGNRISSAADIIENIQDPRHQKNLMQEYLEIQNLEDIDWNDIDKIDNEINAHIDFDQYSKYKNYKINYVKWSNYLSYGPDNYFDFTQLHGLVLLNSEPANQGGKTTFAIDLLRFALFGKAEKSPTLDSVFNMYLPEATEVIVEAGIEIEGINYVIRRTVTRPALNRRTAKSKCKQRLEYFKKNGDNLELIENCEGESTTQTNNIIKEAVGNVNDFNLVISATQYSLGSLLRMGATEKGTLYSRWLGLQSIEEKEVVAKKIFKERSAKFVSNLYNQEVVKQQIEDYKSLNDSLSESNRQATEALEASQKNEKMYSDKLEEKKKELKTIVGGLENIDVTTLENRIANYQTQLNDKRGQLANNETEYQTVKDVTYDENDEVELEKRHKDLIRQRDIIKDERAKANAEYKTLKETIDKKKKLFEDGICPECGQKIDSEFHKHTMEKLNQEMAEFIEEGNKHQYKEKLAQTEADIQKCENDIAALKNKYKDYIKKQQLESKCEAFHTTIAKIESDKKRDEDTLQNIHDNKANIDHNNRVNLDIKNYTESINNEKFIQGAKKGEIASNNTQINRNLDQIKVCEETLNKIQEEEKTKRNWAVYLDIVGKNGIIKLVLKGALPILNNEVARILDGLCDFEVKLGIDDKNNVEINLLRDGVKMDLAIAGSGYEETMASLALRSALAGISTMSKSNFLVLDEVLGQTAAANLDNVHEIFNRIKSNYDFILNITHNEDIADWHDGGKITVTKVKNVSKIKY